MELADYERYLVENNLVVSAKCRYYSSWVRKFFELNLSKQLTNQEKIKQFREYMDVDQGLEDWQRDKALRILRG